MLGIVKKLDGGNAVVEVTRSSACGESCASCGLCPAQNAEITAVNEINAEEGDTVIIDISDKKALGAAFLVYIVPLITLIIGYFAGEAVFNNEGAAVLSGLFIMAITFAAITFTDKRRKNKYAPRIISIKERGND